MKIVENNFKYGEIRISDCKFYKNYKVPFKFCPHCGDLVKKLSRVGFLNEKFSGPGGIVTGQCDTCMTMVLLMWAV